MDVLQVNLRETSVDERESKLGTMAEAWIERGKVEVLTRITKRRLGPLSRTVRDCIAVADPAELDAWSDRVLDADNPKAMFDASSPH